ncbi:hypothetical protein C1H46_045531 [Malus baccata]|uniref:Uncharacterized protein n=1 Tax=Malus baccata TaxID=106549 RepID=A0A540K3X9_MALBA|nr:hypothetical protein C1H46_045531 [Malus baccata]
MRYSSGWSTPKWKNYSIIHKTDNTSNFSQFAQEHDFRRNFGKKFKCPIRSHYTNKFNS